MRIVTFWLGSFQREGAATECFTPAALRLCFGSLAIFYAKLMVDYALSGRRARI